MDVFLWVIFPYLCLATFVIGHFWRYRYDKFGWTTRSSQLYEDRLLRISLADRGSPWTGALETVSATLPAIGGHDRDAVSRLVAQGPPDEEVGLEAFTSSSYLESGARP